MKTRIINLGFQGVCRIMSLDSGMDREFFKCGNFYLDELLQGYDCEKQSKLKIYAALLDNHVIGYYAISANSRRIYSQELASKKEKSVEHGVVFIHGLAVRNDHWDKGIGKALMYHCFETTLKIANLLGVEALCLEAIDEELVKYYEARGFIRNIAYRKRENHGYEMFIRISTLKIMEKRAAQQTMEMA